MMNRRCYKLLLIAVTAWASVPALAHHSFAMFSQKDTVTLKGVVTKFQWTNPHAYLEIDVKQPDGTVKHFTGEGTSINTMQRRGWRSTMVKAGDQVTVVIAPLLSGEPGGLLLSMTLPDGRTFEPGVPDADKYKQTAKPQ